LKNGEEDLNNPMIKVPVILAILDGSLVDFPIDHPIMVDFYANFCGPCKAIESILENLSREYAGRADLVKINVEKNQRLANKYGVGSIPTVLFIKGGKVRDQIVGAMAGKIYREKLQALIDRSI
jgi:thioredoxin 1